MILIGIRIETETLRKIDSLRGKRSRSAFIRLAIDQSIIGINGYIKHKPSLVERADKALKDVGL